MKKAAVITCVFVDIGGVLLTKGWDHHVRKRAVTHFKLSCDEMENRHRLNFATYEEGKLSQEEYLDRVVFHQKRRSLGRSFGASCSRNRNPIRR